MQRQIKFRALYEGVWYYQTLEEILTITLGAFRHGEHKTQYTELKDKNGKEIYEGDICQVMLRHKYGNLLDNQPKVIGAVEFGRITVRDESLYTFNAFHINGRSIEYFLGNELEVVGSIYENQELTLHGQAN